MAGNRTRLKGFLQGLMHPSLKGEDTPTKVGHDWAAGLPSGPRREKVVGPTWRMSVVSGVRRISVVGIQPVPMFTRSGYPTARPATGLRITGRGRNSISFYLVFYTYDIYVLLNGHEVGSEVCLFLVEAQFPPDVVPVGLDRSI